MSITRDFKLSLVAGRSVPLVINANQYDDGEIWRFTLLDENGQKYSPSTGSIIGLKSDGHIIANAGTVSSTGLVIIAETEQMTASPGKNFYELLIDDDTHGTANFVVFVEPRPGADGTPSDSDLAVFQEAITAAGNVTQFQADIANLKQDVDDLEEADTNLASQIAQETSARTQQDAVLQAEIDQIIAPSGEAPSAAEVENARIGANGAVYDTLGNAIRGQVSRINTNSDVTETKTGIIESLESVWHQGYIQSDTGAVRNDPNYCYNDRIRGTGHVYSINGNGSYKVKVVKYNVSGSSYGGVVVPLTNSFPVKFTIGEDESFRIQFGLGDSATTPESITSSVFTLKEIQYTDESLTLSEKSADAKAVGDKFTEINNDIGELSYIHNSSNVYNGVYRNGQIINPDGTITDNADYGFGWDYISVNEGDHVSVGALDGLPTMITSLCAYNANKEPVVNAGVSSPVLYYTVPSDIAYVRLTTNVQTFRRDKARINLSDRLLPYESYYIDKLVPKNFSFKSSSNLLISSAITQNSGHFMRTDGTTGNDAKYSYTHYIPVHEGDTVYLVQNGQIDGTMEPHKFRFVTAFDDTLTPVSAKGSTNVKQYTVPSGVTYIVCSIWLSAYNTGKLAININDVVPYENNYAYVETVNDPQNIDLQTRENSLFDSKIIESPFTTLPKQFVGNMYYKPLGDLKNPYICLVTDDGRIGLNTYTIPMVISKNVPCTFAIMSASEVMQTAENIAIVKDAVDNHGCEISQHGGVNWTEYTEKELNEFFDNEDAFFARNGLTAKSAVIPSHYNSKVISATAGGRYGVVRSGFNGYFEPTIYYGDYLAGARSNLYMLPSFNPSYFETLERNKQILDYAVAHNKIMIIYWHENALTEDHKAVIEGLIDYAKTQPITFITLGDIATRKVI